MRRSVIACIVLSVILTACTSKNNAKVQEDAQPVTETAEATTPAPSEKKEDSELVSLTVHPLICRSEDGEELANGKYPEIRLMREGKHRYPQMRDALDELNDQWRELVTNSVGIYGTYALEDEYQTGPYSSEITAELDRLDDALFTVTVSHYDFSGGAHPGHYIEVKNFDPMTGSVVKLSDVAKEPDKLPAIIENTIYETYPDIKEDIRQYNSFTTEEGGDPSDVFGEKLADDAYSWKLTKKALEITFSPYDIAPYALGYIEIAIPYDKYPDLIENAYIPTGTNAVSKLVKNREDETEEVAPQEPEGMWEDGPGGPFVASIPNPTWERFTDDECESAAQSHISLEKLTENRMEWLDTDKWAAENGFLVERMPYNDGEFYYEPYDPVEYDYMYNSLRIYDKNQLTLLYDLDLHMLVNGPDDKEQRSSLLTQYIKWAKISKDVLYVAAGHNTYSESEPDTSYILAIRLGDGKLLWRSEPLVSNAFNFVIDGDTIICGYGFTAEDDFIYLLDKNTGERIDKIKVNSGPDQFEIVKDTLYVATYNTAYTFKINRP